MTSLCLVSSVPEYNRWASGVLLSHQSLLRFLPFGYLQKVTLLMRRISPLVEGAISTISRDMQVQVCINNERKRPKTSAVLCMLACKGHGCAPSPFKLLIGDRAYALGQDNGLCCSVRSQLYILIVYDVRVQLQASWQRQKCPK